MKKCLLLPILLATYVMHAQPSVVEENKAPIKLSEAVNSYLKHERAPASSEYDDEGLRKGKNVKEGRDYHFSRWLWYWQQHTDEHGYLVSPVRTLREWNSYLKKNEENPSKTTSV